MAEHDVKGQRFKALDAWRGLCALLVALEHINTSSFLHQNGLVHRGYRFVDFFFVLSGFVIAHAYRERLQTGWADVRSFMIRRVGRLWPLHAVVLAGFVAFQVVSVLSTPQKSSFLEHNTISTLPANLLLVQSWGWLHHGTWNNPAWSISTELFAYTVFAAACSFVPRRWLSAAALVIATGSAIVIVEVAPVDMRSTFDFGIFRCLFGFMTGVLVRSLWQRREVRVGTIGELATIAAVIAGVVLLPDGAPALAVTPLFAIAVWVFAAEDGRVSAALCTRAPQALGLWSYSIYMVHALVAVLMLAAAFAATRIGIPLFGRVHGVAGIVGAPVLTTSVTIAYLAIIVALARLTYLRVEVPGQLSFNRWATRSAAPAVAS